ncbi:hypothetical protein U0070_005972, partial [Myodes glareolus]
MKNLHLVMDGDRDRDPQWSSQGPNEEQKEGEHEQGSQDREGGSNQSGVSEFLLLGLSGDPQQQRLLFLLFLTMYLATVLGNLLIILAIGTDSRLHTPMYFFLSNLSFVDVCFSSTTVPKVLAMHTLGTQAISFSGCLTQMYFLFMFVDMDDFLLAVMAYDRYVAICHPLHYTTKMTQKVCVLMVTGSWVTANLNVLLHTLLIAQLSFCGDNAIPHFFCDATPLLKLSCSDTHLNELLILTEGTVTTVTPFVCILISYIHITSAVLRVSSPRGRWKAFSTCGSHLTVVCLFYGTIIAVYFNPASAHSSEKDTAATVLYTVVTPMLNPFIYSLRNRDLKGALYKRPEESIEIPGIRFMDDCEPPCSPMGGSNQSSVSEFLLLGLSRDPQQQRLLFLLFLIMYLATVLGNLLIILAIGTDSRLHTPMYFFLSNLSFVDLCFSSTTVPKVLAMHTLGTQAISFSGCLTQMYFLFMFVDMDDFLLAVMAYDRYVAICHPLHYTTKMTQKVCVLMVAGSWITANLNVLLHTLLMARLSFCGDNAIPHFFCDITPLLKLSCSDTHINELMILTEGAVVTVTPFVCILISYIHITSAVLRVSSPRGRWKAFSTCGSHLTVVCLFYGTIVAVYFNPASAHSSEMDTAATVLYTVVTPMLNPFIYSLRNRDLKGALYK